MRMKDAWLTWICICRSVYTERGTLSGRRFNVAERWSVPLANLHRTFATFRSVSYFRGFRGANDSNFHLECDAFAIVAFVVIYVHESRLYDLFWPTARSALPELSLIACSLLGYIELRQCWITRHRA